LWSKSIRVLARLIFENQLHRFNLYPRRNRNSVRSYYRRDVSGISMQQSSANQRAHRKKDSSKRSTTRRAWNPASQSIAARDATATVIS
jgi:hypothetical protein